MARFNVEATLDGKKVIFGVESGHIVMFHNTEKWDNDAKNKLGIKSGRGQYFSTDLGIAPCNEPTNEQLAQAVGAWKSDVKIVFKGTEPTPQPTVAPQAKPQHTKPQPTIVPQAPQASGNIIDGVATLFGGIASQIKSDVLAEIEPKLNTFQQVQHTITINGGKPQQIKGVVHEKFDDVLTMVSIGCPVYLFGPSGTGKSHIGPQIADALGLDYYQLDKIEQVHDLVGFVDGYGNFHSTPFTDAWTKGGLVLWDEFDGSAPEAALKGNGIAQGCIVLGNGVATKCHPDFRIIATGNTNGQGATEEFTARYQIDAATLNRYVKIDYGYDSNIERAIVQGDMDLLDFVHQLRALCEQKHIILSLGYHNLKNMVKVNQNINTEKAIRYNVVNSLDADTARVLLNALPNYESNWFKCAKKVLKSL